MNPHEGSEFHRGRENSIRPVAEGKGGVERPDQLVETAIQAGPSVAGPGKIGDG